MSEQINQTAQAKPQAELDEFDRFEASIEAGDQAAALRLNKEFAREFWYLPWLREQCVKAISGDALRGFGVVVVAEAEGAWREAEAKAPPEDREWAEEWNRRVASFVPKPQPEDEAETEEEPKAKEEMPEAPFVPDEIKQLNAKHAVISNVGGKCVVMEWVPSVITPGAKEISYQTFTTFRERYANRFVEYDDPKAKGGTSSVALAPWWLTHEHRRQYEGVDLVPNGRAVLPGKVLNLWRGWGVVPQPGDWRLMRRHMEEVLAAGDQGFYDYLVRWNAWKFQNAGAPCETAIVLRGGKGAGKGVFGYALMLIYGPHGLQIFSSGHLCGKHNAHLQNKLFLFLDEAMWGGDRAAEAVLKGMITEKWIMIEPKNVNAFPWNNHLGVLMSANARWVVPASHDERRYAVNNICERWKQNKSYFGPLFKEVEEGGAAAMLYDLLSLDLDGWHPREAIPQTVALVEQKMLSLEGPEQWWANMLGTGAHPKADANARKAKQINPRWITSKTLLHDCTEYSPRNKYLTETEFGRFLSEMGCEAKSNGAVRAWILPPLCEARQSWLARVGGAWEFENPSVQLWLGEEP
jgi:hypothetical protein